MMRWCTRLVAVLVLLFETKEGWAVDRTFTGSGDWFDEQNWDPVGVPGLGDNVTISDGSVDLGADATIGGLTLEGGSLTGGGTLTVSGLVTWANGTMSGTGMTVAMAGMGLGGSGDKTLQARTVVLAGGTASMDDPNSFVRMQSGATFTNQGVFELSNDGGVQGQGFFDNGGGGGTFNNQGTLRKVVTGNSSNGLFNGVTFNNTGTVEVQAGGLSLDGGGTHAGATFTAVGPGRLIFSGTHTIDAASSIAGTGEVTFFVGTTTILGSYGVSGLTTVIGNVTFSGPVSAMGDVQIVNGSAEFSSSSGTIEMAGLSLSGPSILTGGNDLIVSGFMTWATGTMSGTGMTIAMGGMGLAGSAKTLDQRTVVLAGGTASMNETNSSVSMQNGATFTNQGTFELSNDFGTTSNQGFYAGAGSGTFNNQGTLRKTTGSNTGITQFAGIAFSNTGIVEVQAGDLGFGGVGGAFTQTAGVTRLAGGGVVSSVTLDIQGGALEGVGTVSANVASSGELRPGSSPGALTIEGSYAQTASGSLTIEIGGRTAGSEFDTLSVTGAATLAGRLDIQLVGGFEPDLGDRFAILDLGSRVGTFATVDGRDIGNGKSFQEDYLDTAVALDVVAGGATETPTATPSADTPTRTPTSTPTATTTSSPSATATPTASPTPTRTRTQSTLPTLTITGTCEGPGPAGLVPCSAGTAITVSVCNDASCAILDEVDSTVTDDEGAFTIQVESAGIAGARLIITAELEGGGSGPGSGAQTGTIYGVLSFGPLTAVTLDVHISPTTEAALRLLEVEGPANYSDSRIMGVNAAVAEANATTNFAGDTPAGAVDRAQAKASADAKVRARLGCPTDCDLNRSVTVAELIASVNNALGRQPVGECEAADGDGDGQVSIAELVDGVSRIVDGCFTR